VKVIKAGGKRLEARGAVEAAGSRIPMVEGFRL
jgi:hypothetical protein